MEHTARRLVWEHKIKVLFVNYLQYIRSDRYPVKYQQVGDVSARLKAIARDLKIPVIALCQVNRASEGKKPGIEDLHESGDIEQDADQILLLHRDRIAFTDTQDLNICVAKNRHGPSFEDDLKKSASSLRFIQPNQRVR